MTQKFDPFNVEQYVNFLIQKYGFSDNMRPELRDRIRNDARYAPLPEDEEQEETKEEESDLEPTQIQETDWEMDSISSIEGTETFNADSMEWEDSPGMSFLNLPSSAHVKFVSNGRTSSKTISRSSSRY
jgi:hypothetical protein